MASINSCQHNKHPGPGPSTYSPKQLFPSIWIRPEPHPRRQEEKTLQSEIVTKTFGPLFRPKGVPAHPQGAGLERVSHYGDFSSTRKDCWSGGGRVPPPPLELRTRKRHPPNHQEASKTKEEATKPIEAWPTTRKCWRCWFELTNTSAATALLVSD